MRNPAHPVPTIRERLANPPATTWLTAGTTRVRHVLEAVCDEFYVDPLDILSGKFTGNVMEARMVCYWVLKNISRLSQVQVARAFGRTDHSTVGNGIAKTEERRARDPLFKEMTDAALLKSEAARPRSLAA